MKNSLLILAAGLIASSAFAVDIKTTDGTIYRGVEITGVAADAITVSYSDGIARIPFAVLPPEIQKQFNYNPQAAAAAVEAYQEARALRSVLTPTAKPEAEQPLQPDPETDKRLTEKAKEMAKQAFRTWQINSSRPDQFQWVIINGERKPAQKAPSMQQMEAEFKAKLVTEWTEKQLKEMGRK